MSFTARYWKKLDNGEVECNLCPRKCKIKEGQRGLCFVRKCEDGKLILDTYGKSSGFCIDPIEKKPLNHFLPNTSILSFGTAGCNLTCKFCQNWDISKAKETDRLNNIASPKDIAEMAKKAGCHSVAFTYNEPVIFLEYAVDTAKECHKLGIKTVAVTAGYIQPEPCREFFSYMDAANIDLKAFTDDFYVRMCSINLEPVLDTLKYVKNETDVWLEITNLIIPDENDSETEIDEMTKWIVKELGQDVPVHFSAFHPAYKVMDKPRTPASTLTKARKIAKNNGIRHVYTGNVYDTKNASTYCHKCGELLIERVLYKIGKTNITNDGKCKKCGTKCVGVFEGTI